jgi:hypothetical protein
VSQSVLLKSNASPGLGCECLGVPHTRRPGCCLEIPEDRVRRPDLAIYSQQEVIARGGVPTWNSPDIITTNFPYTRLNDETQVTVRNVSDIVAVGAVVHLSISRFGIGFNRLPAGSQTISLAPSASAGLSFPLSRAVVTGDPRIGFHIDIEHPHDRNRLNNAGSQVLAASLTSTAGRSIRLEIPVLNRSEFTRRLSLRVLADDVVATIAPASRSFGPNEEASVSLQTEVPASLRPTPDHGTRREVTVIATTDDGSLVGGLTQHIVVDA